MISRTPCGLAAGMNGKSKELKIWFRPFGRNKIGETPCALGTGIVNFKDFLYEMKNCGRLFRKFIIAVLYKIQRKLVSIELHYRRASKISEETYGAKHIDFTDDLNNLAELCPDT